MPSNPISWPPGWLSTHQVVGGVPFVAYLDRTRSEPRLVLVCPSATAVGAYCADLTRGGGHRQAQPDIKGCAASKVFHTLGISDVEVFHTLDFQMWKLT